MNPYERDHSVAVGRALIFAGAGGLFWLLMSRLTEVGLRWEPPLPAPLWVLGSFVLIVMGIGRLWNRTHPRTVWRPTLPGIRFNSVVVYSRLDCLLCEEALDILSEYQEWLPPAVEVDIDEDPELKALHDQTVPVVAFDGTIRFRGRVDEVLLRRLIDGTKPLGPRHRLR